MHAKGKHNDIGQRTPPIITYTLSSTKPKACTAPTISLFGHVICCMFPLSFVHLLINNSINKTQLSATPKLVDTRQKQKTLIWANFNTLLPMNN
ncbi:hypothetical protein ACE6H2_001810 [Prunus campanulata]